jgi:hypothetical protein
MQPLIQPVVFRRDKVVIDSSGKAAVRRYRANYSFYNLNTDHVEGASILRFDNLMFKNADDEPLGKMPTDPARRAADRIDYCMDIHIVVDQDRLMDSLSAKHAADSSDNQASPLFDIGSLHKTVTIVFDPPQSNGGGSGPPGDP